MEDGFNAADQTVLDFEQLAKRRRPVDLFVIEERKGEHDPSFAIDGDEPSVVRQRAANRPVRLVLLAVLSVAYCERCGSSRL